VIAFFDLLYSLRLRHGGEESIWLIPLNRRKFEVRSGVGGLLEEYLESQYSIESEFLCVELALEKILSWIT
jgi:hypothetical protein